MTARPLVSIVCPAYHEQEVLPSFHQELCRVLAPLGWLAVCALDADGIVACLTDPGFAADPAAVQRRW